MISDKKSTIATTSVDFLCMKIQDGHYQPGPHIASPIISWNHQLHLWFPATCRSPHKQVVCPSKKESTILVRNPLRCCKTTKADCPESSTSETYHRWQKNPANRHQWWVMGGHPPWRRQWKRTLYCLCKWTIYWCTKALSHSLQRNLSREKWYQKIWILGRSLT